MEVSSEQLVVCNLGVADYEPTWRAMREFTAARNESTSDELWLVEHLPVFTLGLAGRPEHLLRETGIPLIRVDRGGQITYHGPGQIVVYLMVDLTRRGLKVRQLVERIEQAVIDLLGQSGVTGERRAGAPGVYVDDAKIAALGLKITRGCSYHGVALNVDMDLSPFSAINPCGYEGMRVTQLRDVGINLNLRQAGERLVSCLIQQLERRA